MLKRAACNISSVFLGKLLSFSHFQGLHLKYEALENIKEKERMNSKWKG